MGKYRPRHDTQYEPFVKLSSPCDCNMAAAADAARYWSLGLIDKNHDEMRHLSGTYHELTDGIPGNNGTNISDALHALEAAGVTGTKTYDWNDGKTVADAIRAVSTRAVVIAHGDYGSVPRDLRGPVSRSYTGLHSVLFHSTRVADAITQVVVGDGLSDPWTLWPVAVATKYLSDFPGSGMTFAVIEPRTLRAKVARANVRTSAVRKSGNVIGRITPRSIVHYGGTVRGERIGTNATWYRVWFKDKIGYVHSSVAVPR